MRAAELADDMPHTLRVVGVKGAERLIDKILHAFVFDMTASSADAGRYTITTTGIICHRMDILELHLILFTAIFEI